MSWRTTGFLFLALLVVGFLVFLQSRREDDPADGQPTALAPASESVNIFEGVEADSIARLDIVADAGAEASFRREPDGGWFMTVPTSTVVISQTVTNSLMGFINTGSRRTFAPDENPLDAYGLVDAVREIVIAVSRGEQVVRYRLQVGNETPAGDAYYVLKEGDERVHLMTKSTVDQILELASDPPMPESLPTPISTEPAATATP